MSNESSSTVEQLVDDVKEYVELQLEYQKVGLMRGASSAASYTIVLLFMLYFLFSLFFFFQVSIAVLISELTGPIWGWLSFFLGHFVLIIFLAIFGKYIRRFLKNRFLSLLISNIEEDEEA